MKDYKTIKTEGRTIEHLNLTVALLKTEKDVKINELFDKIKDCAFMTIKNEYISSIDHVISLVRSWENERLSISYETSAKPILGVDFGIEDIVSIKDSKDMYENSVISIELKAGITLELV